MPASTVTRIISPMLSRRKPVVPWSPDGRNGSMSVPWLSRSGSRHDLQSSISGDDSAKDSSVRSPIPPPGEPGGYFLVGRRIAA